MIYDKTKWKELKGIRGIIEKRAKNSNYLEINKRWNLKNYAN